MKIATAAEMRQIIKDQAYQRRHQILALKNKGMSLTQIGSQLGVSKQRVSDLIKRAKAEV